MGFKIFQFSFGDGYAGSAKIAILSSKLLVERGHDVTLFASKNSLTEKRGKENNVNVISLDSTLKIKILMKEISKYFEEKNPQFVLSHHSLDRKVGFKLKSKYGKEFFNIAYRHNITKSAPIIGPFLYNRYYDYLIACSKGVGDSLIKSGIKKNKVKIVYNGIEVPDNIDSITGEKIREKYSLKNKIVLGLSTWFHKERKGFDILFNAVSQLDKNMVLMIVGIPEENQNNVINYAEEFSIEKSRIIMPGYVDNIWDFYKAMDVFLLPSRSEGFSLALLEAAAAKLPIIASNIPGTNEFIEHEINGILFDVNDPTQLTAGIKKIISDKELAARYAQAANQRVMNNFLIKNYADNLESFLKKDYTK
jgi:glycosyltransferase involved in cell wall biosynthesis